MKHQGTKQLKTDRIILRRFTMADTDSMYSNWASDPEVTKFLTWHYHKTIEMTKSVLTDWTKGYINDDYYMWAIVLKENGNEPIGSISVVGQDDDIEMVRIGFCIGKKFWNKGITSEALALLIDFFFKEVGINRIESYHDSNNPGSGKVMLKCGMKYEGTRRKAAMSNQGKHDIVMYGILAEDYEKVNKLSL